MRHVVIVGHCGLDESTLSAFARRATGDDMRVHFVRGDSELEERLSHHYLLLVNRQLSGEFSTDSGVELIRRITAYEDPPVAMLISNYEDAQKAAQEAGAVKGFGKSAMDEPETLNLIRRVL